MRPLYFLLLIPLLSLLPACKKYHLGHPHSSSLPFHSLYIHPIDNQSYAPQVPPLLFNQLHRALQQQGISISSNPQSADASLSITLSNFSETMATTKPDDTAIGNSFTVSLSALLTLQLNDSPSSSLLEKDPVDASLIVTSSGSYQATLYKELPALTQKLASTIAQRISHSWPNPSN